MSSTGRYLPADKAPAATVREKVRKYSERKNTSVGVKLKHGEVFKGLVSQVSEDHFTIAHKDGRQPSTVAYADVAEVKKAGLHPLIVVGIVGGVVFGILVAAMYGACGSDVGSGLASLDLGYHFTDRKVPKRFDPFVNISPLGALFTGNGFGGAGSIGGGVNYSPRKRVGLRTEVHFQVLAVDVRLTASVRDVSSLEEMSVSVTGPRYSRQSDLDQRYCGW